MGGRVKEHLRFHQVPNRGKKTDRYEVRNVTTGQRIGWVKWYAPWRQYCFHTELDRKCMRQICTFIDDLMERRKK